jgi:hypothetical protein
MCATGTYVRERVIDFAMLLVLHAVGETTLRVLFIFHAMETFCGTLVKVVEISPGVYS